MMNLTENMNEQFKKMAEMQSQNFEPMRAFASLATDAVEQMTRQNYAVAGDFIDYAVKQAHLPLGSENMSEVAAAQMSEATNFSELMNSRVAEYTDMAQQFSNKAKEAVETATASYK